jgi:hypothetical protein
MNHLRFTPAEHKAMADICRVHDLGRVNLSVFSCLLAIELTDDWPHLSRRIDALSHRQMRLLHERMPGHPGPQFSAAEIRAVAVAWGPMPLTGRFVRPLRRQLIVWLIKSCPKLARRVARLSDEGFGWLCGQLQGRREAED